MKSAYDVVILGGGPSGLAAATTLALRGISVVVLERSRIGSRNVGETFGPEIRPLLKAMGALGAIEPSAVVPFRGVRSAWGSSDLGDRPSILNPLGEGVHVDRAHFDGALAYAATRAGATIHEGVGVASITAAPNSRGWVLHSADVGILECRFIMDASGRGAPGGAAGIPGRTWLACDRTVAIAAQMAIPRARTLSPELFIESAEDGFWYAVPLPNGTLLVVLLTDADGITAGPRPKLAERFLSALEKTLHVRALVGDASIEGAPKIVRAEPGCLVPNRGLGWCAIGDAAAAGDPISGDGVARGLRSAQGSSDELSRALLEGREAALAEKNLGISDWFTAYLDTRAYYYRIEDRFPDALFWARRRPLDWRKARVSIDPHRMLFWDGHEPDASVVAPVEALVPPRAIRVVLARLRTPNPAHEALKTLAKVAPLGNHRLLVGLDGLVARGIVSVDR